MAYNYYHSAPGWGTNQFRFAAPPVPGFQPTPSWNGMDYYRAHAVDPDLALYDHAWDRVRNYSHSGLGVGMHEARHWHRRAYGGLGELSQMHPEEIGHAAAYEAYRTWIHNGSVYEPLGGDIERQREGLVGYAIAEATKLLQYTGRPLDQYSRMTASDAAAATASEIFYQSLDGDDYRIGRPRSRSFSAYDASPYSSAGSLDPYAYDNVEYPFSRRHHGHHRPRRLSGSVYGGSDVGSVYPSGYVNAMTLPGTPYPGYASYGQPMYGYPGSYGSYPGVYPGAGGYGYPGAGIMPGSIVVESKPRRHSSRHSRHSSRHRSRSRHRGVVMAGTSPYY